MDQELMSFQVRLVIARMARLVRKFDGMATGLSSEDDILQLIGVASGHVRPEVQSVYDEMLYLMSNQELQYLVDRGLDLPEAYRKRLVGGVASKRPRRVYRGQVLQD